MRILPLLALLTACGGTPSEKPADPAQTAEKPATDAYVATTETPADVAAPPADAKKTESGLAYKVLHAGTGTEHPDDTSKVTVHYTGWTTDGKKFDSSRDRSEPSSFGLKQVIAGWTEGLQLMKNGDHVRFWIPEELAYQGRPGKPAGMLVFDVELIEFVTPPKPPEAPSDVAAAPADAKVTASGLAYKVVKKGPGGKKPTANDFAIVHYAGWTAADGKNFDFSRKRDGNPASFGVGQVIPGWTEGLQLMETGDSYRFWIPPELAYEGKRGPQGTLVFDVELIDLVSPPDLVAPADAKAFDSGLKMKLLSAPGADSKPPEGAKLEMNWRGWTADGAGFDSNLGRPAAHPMGQLRALKGLNEAAYMLNKGEKALFWIPEDLAFAGRPGAPEGHLVYELELIDFEVPPPRPTPQPAAPAPDKPAGH